MIRAPSLLTALATTILLTVVLAQAQDDGERFVVIVHPRLGQTSIDRDTVGDAFLKKQTRWDDGALIEPVDLDSQSNTRAAFSRAVLKRSVAAVRSYWQQRIFSGRGVPPPEMNSDEATVRYVATHAGGIGYVSRKADLKGVRSVTLRN
jgi:ABC-type phosphate transport system substrate-binding protein